MVKQEDIFKQLQEGADPSVLAQQFADALNAAIAQKNTEDAAKNQKVAEKMARMQAIIDEVFDFIDDFYPDFAVPAEAREQVTAEGIVDAFDEAAAEAKRFAALLQNIDKAPIAREKMNIKPAAAKGANPDAIAAFLRANGLA